MAGFLKIPIAMANDTQLDANAMITYGYLSLLADENGECSITNEELGEWIGKGHQSACRHVRQLQALGYIETRRAVFYHNGESPRVIVLKGEKSCGQRRADRG